MDKMDKIYFEKQSLMLCAKHSLNNLFQKPIYSKEDLDKISESLTKTSFFEINPHKSALGLGNYDINVITSAIQQQNLELQWFDKRKDIQEETDFEKKEKLFGIVVNYKYKKKIIGFIPQKGNHWISIRKIQEKIYIFNSFNDAPQEKSQEDIFTYLKDILQENTENNIFLIMNK